MLEAAAIGVQDDRSGEAVKVVVVRKDPALTEADVLAHCRQRLTGVGACADRDLGIERIDPRGVNPDQDLPFTWNRASDVADGQRDLGRFGDSGKHGLIHDGNL